MILILVSSHAKAKKSQARGKMTKNVEGFSVPSKKAIRDTIFDVLKHIPEFSWGEFKEEMQKEGLVVKTKESNGEVVSYKVHYQGQKNAYTASQIDRSLTAAHIAQTCEKVCRQDAIERAKLYMQEYARQHPEVQFVEAEDNSEEYEMFARSDKESRASYDDKQEDGDTIHHHYQFGFYKCDFSLKRIIESLLQSGIK